MDYSTFLDALASFGRGAATGGASLFTIPGDLRQGVRSATDPLFDYIDSSLGYQRPPTAPTRPYYDIMPTTEDLRGTVSNYLGSPQTEAGKTAQTFGELAPFMLGGPMALKHMNRQMMGPIADTLGSYIPPEALWSLLAGAAAVPGAWVAAHPEITKKTNNIFLKSHMGGGTYTGGASPAY
jgi:hypothetical protein